MSQVVVINVTVCAWVGNLYKLATTLKCCFWNYTTDSGWLAAANGGVIQVIASPTRDCSDGGDATGNFWWWKNSNHSNSI